MKKAVIPHKIKEGNSGDILINFMLLIELLRNNITVYVVEPQYSNYRNQIKSIKAKDNLEVIKPPGNIIDKFYQYFFPKYFYNRGIDSVFATPGHISTETFTVKGLIKCIVLFLRVYLYKNQNINFYFFSVTLGPFHKKYSSIVKRILKQQNVHVFVREKTNLQHLQYLYNINASFVPDLAFLLRSDLVNDSNLNFDLPNDPYWVYSFRGHLSKKNDEKYSTQLLNFLEDEFKNTANKEVNIVLSYQVIEDRDFCLKMKDLLESLELECLFIDKLLSFEQASYLYSKASSVMTNRLHVAIITHIMGKEAWGCSDLVNHSKLVNYFEQNNLKRYLKEIALNSYEQSKNPSELNTRFIDEQRMLIQNIIKTL